MNVATVIVAVVHHLGNMMEFLNQIVVVVVVLHEALVPNLCSSHLLAM
jgi:hypothetical protein